MKHLSSPLFIVIQSMIDALQKDNLIIHLTLQFQPMWRINDV
jgi:hypothetical protein